MTEAKKDSDKSETSGDASSEPAEDQNASEPAPAPAAPSEPEIAPEVEPNAIKYTGGSDVRRLSADDLIRMGASDVSGGLEWSRANGFLVPISQISPSIVAVLLARSEFSAVTV